MADIKLVGAVAIKVRPDARGFRGATQKAISKELAGVDGKVKIKVTADTAELAKDVAKAKEKAEKTSVTLRVGVDYDSLRAAQRQLDAAVKNLGLEKLEVKLDQKGIEEAREFLDALVKDSNVTMKFTPDEKGYQQVLDRIAAIRREKLEKPIEFAIDENSLLDVEREMREALEKLVPPQLLSLSLQPDRDSLRKAIDEIDKALADIRSVKLDVTMDEQSLNAARRDLEERLARTPVDLKINYDDQESIKGARERLQGLLNEITAKTLTVDYNEEAIRAELRRLDDMIEEEVKEKRPVELPVHTTGLEIVARQLQFASRARRVPFYVVVDAKSVLVAEGILRSLAGVNTLQSAGRGLETLITKFDTISLKAAGWGAAIGGITDALLHMLTTAFAVGDGMAEVVGLLALAPTAMAVVASTAIIATMAFDNMKKALDGDAEALAKLPPAAQAAVRALDGTWESIQRPVQQAFWEEAGTSLQDFVNNVIPQFESGLTRAAAGMGRGFSEILKGFNTIAISGDLERMFDNLESLFDSVGKAAAPLVEAFNTLGLRGSTFLPRFGEWILDITTRFRDWIVEADRLGDINAWIEDGIVSLKDMWHSAGAIIDQFKALARASAGVNASGLDDFRRNMQHIAKIMLAEPFQSRLTTIFAGARAGAHELNVGVKDLGRTLGEAASFTGELLTLLGKLGGQGLSGLSRTFSSLTFQTGTLDSLRGMSEMLREMEPAFSRLGDLLGNVGKISGEVFRNLGPVFNSVMGILDDAVDRVGENLAKVAPGLLTLTNNMLNLARGPIMLAVEALNAFLGVINSLPAPLRDAALAFGTFLLLRNQFGAFASALSGLWTRMTSSVVTGTASIATATAALNNSVLNGVPTNFRRMADGSIREVTRFGTVVGTGMRAAQASLNSFNADVIPTRLQAAVGPVVATVGRINSALSLIGGIPGLILGGLGIALAAIGGNAASAAANIDALKVSLDKTTGGATLETFDLIARKISDIDEAGDAWANFWRGVMQNSKAGNETLEQLGMNIGDVSRIIAGNQAQYDAFIGQMKTLSKMDLGGVADFMKSGKLPDLGDSIRSDGAGPQTVTSAQLAAMEAAAKAAKSLNISPEQLQGLGGSLQKLTGDIEEQRKAWEASQIAQKIYADTMGTTMARAQEIAAVTRVLGDTSRDSSTQIDAMRRSLELLNNTGLSEQEAKIARQDNLGRAVENAKNLAASIAESRSLIFDQNGLISEQSKAGRDLYAILKEGADNVLIHAKGAYNTAMQNGETATMAMEKARAVVAAGETDLASIASAAGMTVSELRGQWNTFFGADWTLTATFTGTTEQYKAAMAEANALGLEFNEQEFTAWLMAHNDPAKVSINDVLTYVQGWVGRQWDATLGALPAPAQAAIVETIGKADEFARGDYEAILRALNSTEPGVQAALSRIYGVTNGDYSAAIKAFMDAYSASVVQAQLNALAANRTVYIDAVLRRSELPDLNGDASGSGRPGLADGGFFNAVRRAQDLFSGKYQAGMFKAYANGGIERHVAQIASGRGPVRIWGEKETQGEAYIPLAVSKRPRSVSILGEVARKFGYELTRANHFANGSAGPMVPTRTSTSSVTIGTINTVDPKAAVRELQKLRNDALAVAGVDH